MVDEEKLSPEERLLRAVEGGTGKTESAPKGVSKGTRYLLRLKRYQVPFGTLFGKVREALELKWHELRGRRLIPSFSWPTALSEWRFDLRTLNMLITGTVVLMLLFLVIGALFFKPEDPLGELALGPGARQDLDLEKGRLKPMEDYTGLAERRNLFRPFTPEPAPAESAAEGQAAPLKAGENFKIVGIASTEEGLEAILEDVNVKESYFVKEGDQFQSFEVESITWDHVVLKKDGERWELR